MPRVGHGHFPPNSLQFISHHTMQLKGPDKMTAPYNEQQILLEKLLVAQPVKKFSTIYGTQYFITVFTPAATGLCSEPREFILQSPTPFL
jgi:hypothetical protein